jgi:Cu2+-exporting ATPase
MQLVEALDTSRRTRKVIRQNMAWALVYNVCALPLAAAGLVPPWLAAIGMSLSSLIVVLNALRLGTETRPVDRG